jgi:hypothetical protein
MLTHALQGIDRDFEHLASVFRARTPPARDEKFLMRPCHRDTCLGRLTHFDAEALDRSTEQGGDQP